MIFLTALHPLVHKKTTLRLVLTLATLLGWHSLDLDAVCAFISSDLAKGEHVYMKALLNSDVGEGICLSMEKCIYGLVHNIIFFVVKSMVVLAFNVFALMSVSLSVMC